MAAQIQKIVQSNSFGCLFQMSPVSCHSIGKVWSKLSLYYLLDLAIAILNSLRIFSSFDGGSKEMGRYPFDKTLIALEYNSVPQ